MIVLVVLLPVSIGLLSIGFVANFIATLPIVVALLAVPFVLKYKQSTILSSLIFICVAYGAITSTLFINTAIGVISILWYVILLMFSLYTAGRIWSIIVGISCLAPYIYYVLYKMEDNLQNVDLYSTPNLILISACSALALVLIYYIVGQFIKTTTHAETQLKHGNAELETQNTIILKQNEEKESMLKEIHHRVKNNMQIINSLLRLQSNEIEDETTLKHFKEAQSRIFSMALIHEKMYQSKDLAHINLEDYFESLVGDLIKTYNLDTVVKTDIQVESVILGTKTLVPLGLIINEIVSNSLEHGFKDRQSGKITLLVEAYKTDYRLTIGDDGVGMPYIKQEDMNASLGMELIQTFADQLNGRIEMLEEDGTMYELVFEHLEDDEPEV